MQIVMPSVMSLLIELTVLEESLSTGTGFLVRHGEKTCLVTNRHNLSGRRSDSNEAMSQSTRACPDAVKILHNSAQDLGIWNWHSEPLYDDDGRPLWREHPIHGRAVDIAVLPLTQINGTALYPYSLDRSIRDLDVRVADELSIVGFPFGISSAGALAIWTRGVVASEIEANFMDLPCYLVDSRTRKGQSGSPVIFYSKSGEVRHGGGLTIGPTNVFELQGIYSGRINEESDLGIVWKVQAIREVIEQGVRPEHNNL